MLGRLRDMRQCNSESQNLKIFPSSATALTEAINTPIAGNPENSEKRRRNGVRVL